MDFMEMYAQKKMTAEQAASLVKSGDWVDYGWCVNTPVAVDAALAKRLPELENVNFRGGILMWVPEIFQIDDPAAHMTWNSWHMGGIERKAIAQGFSFYSPIRYSELPRYYRESPDPLDIAVFQVTPMDEHGYFNFGPSASHLGAVCEKAKKIIVEVNTNMPRCLGGMENCVHISQVTGIVEGDNPPIGQMAAAGPASEVDLKVANLVVPQIPNGACLQLGIGAIPDATGMALKAKHDLGIHTEMFTDSMVELIECGAVNNSKKQIHRGKTVTTFAFGSQRIYDYIDDNPAVEILPVEYVNDPDVICQNDNMISINAALEVDFFGQVCAESVGTKHMSGSGGQIDYVRGACQSKGGKSFIAFTSTAKGGTISKIKPILTPGAICTTSKNDVDYIVTEYGIAHLRGRSLGERTKQLIAIAHPDFRDELTFEAKKRGIMI